MHFPSASKSLLRTLPGVKQLLHMKHVHGKEIGHFSGIYRTAELALQSIPVALRSTWDDDDLIENGIPAFSSVHGFDWPVIRHLRQRVAESKLHVVTDFGGHIGVKHTAYSQVIDFPAHLQWQVVDVPAVLRAARRYDSPERAALRFYERLEDTAPCEVLLCSGSLQYTPDTLEDLVGRMPKKPETILLNKVPVSAKRPFFTVERYIKSLAYRIFGPRDLAQIRSSLGYALSDSWTIPSRDILVLHSRGVERVQMVGEAWTLLPPDVH